MMGSGSFVRLGLDQLLYLRALVHQREVRMGFAMLIHISTFMPPKLTCTQNINWTKINDRDVRIQSQKGRRTGFGLHIPAVRTQAREACNESINGMLLL